MDILLVCGRLSVCVCVCGCAALCLCPRSLVSSVLPSSPFSFLLRLALWAYQRVSPPLFDASLHRCPPLCVCVMTMFTVFVSLSPLHFVECSGVSSSARFVGIRV